MTWRHLPTTLGLLAAITLGWYLVYTELLVREMRRDASVHSRIYVHILQGLNDPMEGAAEHALLNLVGEVQRLGIPIVVTDAEGIPAFASNLPFEAQPLDPRDAGRLLEYTRELAEQNTPVIEPAFGTIYYGDPPLVRRLRWVPYLQVGALVGLLVAAAWMIHHNLRTERERIWAAMARESAHQMGTPLSSLAGWVEILRLSPEEREGMASLPAVAAEMEADIERLEKVSHRFEWIGRPLRHDLVEIPVLLRALERYVRVRLPQVARGVELHVGIEPDLPPVLGNAVLLEWALENLIKNALDALAGTGGHIDIGAERSGGRVTIRVRDDGPGIPPATRGRIFEPGVTTKKGGWGVGLSLARRIVEDVHGGHLLLDATDTGASFRIVIPAADRQSAASKG